MSHPQPRERVRGGRTTDPGRLSRPNSFAGNFLEAHQIVDLACHFQAVFWFKNESQKLTQSDHLGVPVKGHLPDAGRPMVMQEDLEVTISPWVMVVARGWEGAP